MTHCRFTARFTDYEPFRAWRADPSQWLPVALDIARSHGLENCTNRMYSPPAPISSSVSTTG
jgi:hypothetical protein